MSYTAKSLEEIAAMFEGRAAECQACADVAITKQGKAADEGEAAGWRAAANILRRTTITEPVHMEKP